MLRGDAHARHDCIHPSFIGISGVTRRIRGRPTVKICAAGPNLVWSALYECPG